MAEHKIYNTPLFRKIGIEEGMQIALIGAPSWIIDELRSLNYSPDINKLISHEYRLIWLFENTCLGMESKMKNAQKHILKNGMIWVSWYKKASKKSTELNEDIIRSTALALDLVDVKVASVNEDWSALKLVIPVAKRGFSN